MTFVGSKKIFYFSVLEGLFEFFLNEKNGESRNERSRRNSGKLHLDAAPADVF